MTAAPLSDVPASAGTEVSLRVGGMTCGSCAARIERCLNDIDGVEATVNYGSERARAVVAVDVPVQRLIDEVRDAGYRAELIPAVGSADSSAPEDAATADQAVRSLGRRLVVAALLFMPLCDLSLAFSLSPSFRFPYWQWLLVVVAAPVVTWAAWPFHRAALRHAWHRTSTMDTLVSIGIVAATSWSLYATFSQDTATAPRSVLFVIAHQSGGGIYLDVAAGVTTSLLAGRYFEARFRRRTGNALRSLAAVGAKDVAVLDAVGFERRVSLAQLQVGDRFVVRPGETVATDGEVIFGHSAMDRSAMTGESVPVDVAAGDKVLGGTVSEGGRLVVRATRVGSDTQLARMVRLVEDAQNDKAAVQRLADRISGVFVPTVLVIAAVTLAAWLGVGGTTEQAFRAALSVLIIACPCALGLATPAALLVATGRGARLGIFFKNYQALEASRQIDTVMLDKTGTVTEGHMAVTDIEVVAGFDQAHLLRWAGAVEQASEHLIARAITTAARKQVGALPPVDRFVAFPGLGATGTVDGEQVTVGKAAMYTNPATLTPPGVSDRCAEWEALGRTVVLVGHDRAIVGAVALADTVRPSAAPAVTALQALGLHCILVTGDNACTARAVAASIGITDILADTLPADKAAAVRRLQQQGRSVAVVGDGINDAPALATADLGLAVGSGTDVAINAADLIVTRDDLRVVATAIVLARRTLRTIRGNLIWAFAYNLVALPLAAVGLLDPLIAGAAMALSSSFVLWNSARLRHTPNVAAVAATPAGSGGPLPAQGAGPLSPTPTGRP